MLKIPGSFKILIQKSGAGTPSLFLKSEPGDSYASGPKTTLRSTDLPVWSRTISNKLTSLILLLWIPPDSSAVQC